MKTLRDAIVTVLDGIKVAAGFNAVYYDMPTKVETTPAVVVLFDGASEEYETTAHDSLIADFTVRLMLEKQDSSDNDRVTTSKVLTIGDLIMAEFRKKTTMTLSGASYFLVASRIEKLLVGPLENMNVFYLDIILTVKTIKDVT